jgi:hypothetical protein
LLKNIANYSSKKKLLRALSSTHFYFIKAHKS